MATLFWVGGTGTYDGVTNNFATSSGGTATVALPTSSDTVTFDSLSNATAYTVTISAQLDCSNLTIGNPLSGVITFAGSSAINCYGNFAAPSGGTWTYSGTITFKATSSGKTITLNSVTTGSPIVFDGVGGVWTLQDNWNNGTTSSKTITLNKGTLDTNGKTVTCYSLGDSGSSTRVLTLGASTINLSGYLGFSATGLTVSGNTSSIIISPTGSGSICSTGGKAFYDITINAGSSNLSIFADTSASIHSLTMTGSSSKLCNIALSNNVTCSSTVTINGNSTTSRLYILSSTKGTARTITAATVSVTYADFQDITGAGAGSWNLAAITGNSGDCGGNTNITFTTPATQHWTNASSGSWSSSGNWTSRVPLPQDNVVMDKAFGTSQTVTADMPRLGASVDWTGATWTTALTWTMSNTISIFGSLTLISGLTVGTTQFIVFEGRGSYTINTKGITLENPVNISCTPTGTYTLAGDFTMGVTRTLQVLGGNLDVSASNYVLSVGKLTLTNSAGSTTVNLRASTHLLTGTATVFSNGPGVTLTATSSIIKIVDTSNSTITFGSSTALSSSFGVVWFARGASTGSITIAGSKTYIEFKDTGTGAHSLLFVNGTTQTVTTFTVSGSAGNVISINSDTTGTHSLVKNGGGTVSSDYLNIQHSVATPSSTWYAGVNSTNNQAVATAGSGWNFTVPPVPGTNTGNFFTFFN